VTLVSQDFDNDQIIFLFSWKYFLFPELELKENVSNHRDLRTVYVYSTWTYVHILVCIMEVVLYSVLNDINYMVHKITTKIV